MPAFIPTDALEDLANARAHAAKGGAAKWVDLREAAIDRAERQGLEACAVCGRGIKDLAAALAVLTDGRVAHLGPECVKHAKKAGLL